MNSRKPPYNILLGINGSKNEVNLKREINPTVNDNTDLNELKHKIHDLEERVADLECFAPCGTDVNFDYIYEEKKDEKQDEIPIERLPMDLFFKPPQPLLKKPSSLMRLFNETTEENSINK
jgi:hypothetical protein